MSGDPQGGANSVSHVDGVLNMAPAGWLYGSVGGGFRKRPMACISVWEKAVSPLMPGTSLSPCVPLVPFKLLLQCWMELRGSESE